MYSVNGIWVLKNSLNEMKKIAFFITHKTLDLYHADLCFKSIGHQKNVTEKFDKLYIYNSHEQDISNESILHAYKIHNLQRIFKEVVIYDYNPNTGKTLGSDITEISNYFCDRYDDNDRVLILKSDCLMSVNYFNEFNKLNDIEFFS